ncbi:MAG: SPOR domain-containing protein [Treponema sp.]|nr:SPOR domain-containing protein [Treponema sp.]
MKKIISLILTTFTVAILFAAARPSLDGRAVVAEDGEMPKGLFARTIGYLPGDSVTVTNPANGNACDVLILGSIDASEGVAILLSPEAADRLAIRKDSNVQVKITKRTGSLDENVSGTATLSDEDDTDYNSGSLTEETAQAPEETPAPEAAEALAEETSGESSEVPAEEVAEEIASEPVEVTEADSEGPVMSADSFDAEEPVEEAPAEAVAEEEAPAETPAEAVVVEAPAEEEKTELVAEEEIPEEAVPEELVEAEAPSLATVTPNDVVIPDNFEELANEAGKAPVQEVVSESAPEVPSEESVVEEPSADEYAPIVLVPSEPNPPEETEVPKEVPVETPVEIAGPAAETAPVTETAPAIEIAPVESVTSGDINFENFIKPSLKDLESGKYYVQIASLGQKENIESLLAKYTPKYPVVLVPLSNGKGYQVLVGPLTADEYGMIIERFQSYGFKDCFLRKIK